MVMDSGVQVADSEDLSSMFNGTKLLSDLSTLFYMYCLTLVYTLHILEDGIASKTS